MKKDIHIKLSVDCFIEVLHALSTDSECYIMHEDCIIITLSNVYIIYKHNFSVTKKLKFALW